MPEYVLDFFDEIFYGPFFQAAKWIWVWIMQLSTGLISESPEKFSPDAWKFVTEILYPWALGIGVVCLNLFFMIGFLRSISNLKENLTLEMCVEAMIRLVAVNALLQTGLTFIRTFFQMASLLAGQVISFDAPDFFTNDNDLGAHLFWWLFGFGYFLVAVVCAVMIFLTLYGRYVKLYLLIIFYPLAMPTLAGGRGMDASAVAWVKTFLSNAFEIVAIALVISITGRLIGGINMPEDTFTQNFDGFAQAIQSIFYMILMAVMVKGVGPFLNKSFNL